MSKTLQVVEPFFTLDAGDILEYSDSKKMYILEKNEEFHKHGDDSEDVNSTYSSTFTISVDYAKELIKHGLLEEVMEDPIPTKGFTNIFTEIDNLLYKYTKELNNVDAEMENMPQCLKVEKITVLKNIIEVLNHLKSLKK